MTERVPRFDPPRRAYKNDLLVSGGPWGSALGRKFRGQRITCIVFAATLALPTTAYAVGGPAPQPQESQPVQEPAAAQTTPAPAATEKAQAPRRTGMVRYQRPVFHNGHRVLWHGAWRDAARGREAVAKPGPAKSDSAASPASAGDFVILSDGADASATRMAAELAQAMENSGLHVRAVAGKASIATLDKATSGEPADLAIVPIDALANGPATKDADWRARTPYLARLANEPVAVIAPRSIADIHQLAGRKVNVAAADGATAATAAIVFSRLNIAPKATNEALPDALSHLAHGDIDAVFTVGASDSKALADFGKDGRFHVLPIPYVPALQVVYSPMRLTAREEANLIGSNDKVDTIGVPTALVAVDAAPNSPRAGKLAPLTDRLFAQFDQTLGALPDSHWREVNLAAKIGGLPRFGATQVWLDQNQGTPDAALATFRAAADTVGGASEGPGGADSDKLYDKFMKLSGAAQ